MDVTWSDIKSLLDSGQARLNYIERSNEYYIIASGSNLNFHCVIQKSTDDATEFETSYKTQFADQVSPVDSDGSVISRTKTTRTGWHYEPRSLDFYTSTLGSLYNRKHSGHTIDASTDYNDATIKFFDASGVELTTQETIDTDCVRTQIDWQPTFEIDIIGTTVSVINPPVAPQRAYAWVIVAPDIPENLGGSVPFMAGGWNLRFFANNGTTFLDGRGVKSFPYDPVYNSNKFRLIIKHDAGLKIGLQFVAEIFKA